MQCKLASAAVTYVPMNLHKFETSPVAPHNGRQSGRYSPGVPCLPMPQAALFART